MNHEEDWGLANCSCLDVSPWGRTILWSGRPNCISVVVVVVVVVRMRMRRMMMMEEVMIWVIEVPSLGPSPVLTISHLPNLNLATILM